MEVKDTNSLSDSSPIEADPVKRQRQSIVNPRYCTFEYDAAHNSTWIEELNLLHCEKDLIVDSCDVNAAIIYSALTDDTSRE